MLSPAADPAERQELRIAEPSVHSREGTPVERRVSDASSRSPDCGGLSVAHFAPVLPANATASIAPSTTSTTTTIISAIADNGISGVVVGVSEDDTERHAHAHANAQASSPPTAPRRGTWVIPAAVEDLAIPMVGRMSGIDDDTVSLAPTEGLDSRGGSPLWNETQCHTSVSADEDHSSSAIHANGTDNTGGDSTTPTADDGATPTAADDANDSANGVIDVALAAATASESLRSPAPASARRQWAVVTEPATIPPPVNCVSPNAWLTEQSVEVSAELEARLLGAEQSIQLAENELAELARLPELERRRAEAELRRAYAAGEADIAIAAIREELEVRRTLLEIRTQENAARRAEEAALKRAELEARFEAAEAKRVLDHQERVMQLQLKQEEAEEARLRADLDKQLKAAEFAKQRVEAKAKRDAVVDSRRAELEDAIEAARVAHEAAKLKAQMTRDREAQAREERQAREAARRQAVEECRAIEEEARRAAAEEEIARAQREAEDRVRDLAAQKAEEEALSRLVREQRRATAELKRQGDDELRKVALEAKKEALLESERRAEEELQRKVEEAAVLRIERQRAAEIRRKAEQEARRRASEMQSAKIKAIKEKAEADAELLLLETQAKVDREARQAALIAEAAAQQVCLAAPLG